MEFDQMDFLQAPRLQALKEQMMSSKSEDDKKKFLTALVREIVNKLNSVTVSKIQDGVTVNNLDEIKASLRNELSKANKPITDILNKLNISTQEQTDFLKEIEDKAENKVDDSIKTVEVKNLSDIVFPSDIKVNNLEEVCSYLEDLIIKVEALKLSVNVEAPQVNIPAPEVIVNPTPVSIPPLDLSPLLDELSRSLKLLRTNNKSNPLAVRLTDGADWVKELKSLNKQAAQTTQFMSDVSYIRDASGQRINPATVEGQSFMLVPRQYDYISLSYTGDNATTVVYKTGGSGGTVVATLSISYVGANISSVTRT